MLNYLSITLCMIDIKWKTIMKPNNKNKQNLILIINKKKIKYFIKYTLYINEKYI